MEINNIPGALVPVFSAVVNSWELFCYAQIVADGPELGQVKMESLYLFRQRRCDGMSLLLIGWGSNGLGCNGTGWNKRKRVGMERPRPAALVSGACLRDEIVDVGVCSSNCCCGRSSSNSRSWAAYVVSCWSCRSCLIVAS